MSSAYVLRQRRLRAIKKEARTIAGRPVSSVEDLSAAMVGILRSFPQRREAWKQVEATWRAHEKARDA